MGDSVTVDHGGLTVTTNTATEADLRAELARDDPAPAAAPPPDAPPAETPPPTVAEPPRDEKGRFVAKEAAAAPAEPAPPDSPAESAPPPARRRDDTLPRHNPIARMNQALAQKAEAERRPAALEAELARYRPPAATSPVTPPAGSAATNGSGEPDYERDFAANPAYADPYTAYLQAWTRWDRAQAIAQARSEWEAAQAAKTRDAHFTAALADGRRAHADFDQ